MSNKTNDYIKKNKKLFSDLLELSIVVAFLFMIVCIYVPRAIWDEEEFYQNKSHFNMENLFDAQNFYKSITGEYSADGWWTFDVVNSVRDSLTGDSTYLGSQLITLNSKTFEVNIPKGFDIEFDTTFGFPMSRRDTIFDTTATIIMFSEDLSRNDTSYIQKRLLANFTSDSNFVKLVEEVPTQRVEVVNFYDTYMPDSSMNVCPVTNIPYDITIKDEGNSIRVDSPIKETVVRRRFALFSFKASNHGYINDGTKSWDRQ